MRRGILTKRMDTIFIDDLRVETRIGVYDSERQLPQTVRLDVELALPSDKVFRSGRFADTLDYSAVVERLRAVRRRPSAPAARAFRAGACRRRARRIPRAVGQGSRREARARQGREGDRRRDRAHRAPDLRSAARMVLRVQLLQPLARDVRVDRRRRDVGVAEQQLHDAQIRAVVQEMRRERVAQHVRRQARRRECRPSPRSA